MLDGLHDGFGYFVVRRNLEERRVGLSAVDILHRDGGLLAGLGVLGNGEDDGGKFVGAPSILCVIAGGNGGFSCADESCDAHHEVGSGAVRFDSLDGMSAEVCSHDAFAGVEAHARRAECARCALNPRRIRRARRRTENFCSRVQRVELRHGLGDRVTNHNYVLLDLGTGIRSGVTFDFFGDTVDSDAALAITRDQLGIARNDALRLGRTGGSHDFGVKRIVGADADVAVADGVRAALRVGRRGGDEQRNADGYKAEGKQGRAHG